MPKPRKYKFTATLEQGDGGGAYILFPYDMKKEFGTNGRVPVQALLNGIPYTGSLMKYGRPQHMLVVLKSIREQTGASIGSTIEVELRKEEGERKLDVPPAFLDALKRHNLLAAFERMSYTHRKEYCRWIAEAKKEETRAARIEKATGMLKGVIRKQDTPKRSSVR